MKLIKQWYLPDEDISFEKYYDQNQNYQYINRLKSLKFVNSFNLAV
jgi:hypothetical protein